MAFSYRVSLQVNHPDADPKSIAEGIGLRVKRSWAVGDDRQTPKGTPLSGRYRESNCVFELGDGNDGELADFLRRTTSELEYKAAFIDELRGTGGKLNFYITWSPGERGEVFDVELLTAMARLGIDLGIEPIC